MILVNDESLTFNRVQVVRAVLPVKMAFQVPQDLSDLRDPEEKVETTECLYVDLNKLT